MTNRTATQPTSDALDDKIATAVANAQAKHDGDQPVLHEILFPVNVSYFAKTLTNQEGEQFTAHEFSISIAHKNKEGETEWRSVSLKRRDAHKLLTALQSAYEASYKIKPAEVAE